MKRQGDIQHVEAIETIIRNRLDFHVIKDGKASPHQQSKELPSMFSRIYEFYAGAFVFELRLEYDYRIRRGRVSMADEYMRQMERGSEAYFMNDCIKEIVSHIKQMAPMSGNWQPVALRGRY